jgi:hypothetical protein
MERFLGLTNLFSRGSEKDRFARIVMARLRKIVPPIKNAPLYDSNRFMIALGDTNMFLHNAFNAWKAARTPVEKERQLEIAIGFLSEKRGGESFEIAAPSLLPAVRNRSHMASVWLTDPGIHKPDAYAGSTRPICESLVLAIASDRPTSMDLVTESTLKGWSKSLDDVLLTAIDNLRARSSHRFKRMEGGFCLSHYDDCYDSARILLPHLFDQLFLKGDPVVVVLCREGIVVAGSDDVLALTALANFVDVELAKSLRPISCEPIV